MYVYLSSRRHMLLKSLQYDTAKRWADYLVNNTLTPLNQYVGFDIY